MAVYGIDLGAAESRIAYVDDTGQPALSKNALGEETTPSVVYFESPENVVVGRDAKSLARLYPDLVVEMVIRQMGKDVHYSFHGQDYTPESVSALILRELARAAQEWTGEEVRDVVITVPAYFGLLEREATHKAGQIAGLNVLDILDEPVAAALNYQALGEDAGVRNILVYHLGRGTFDTAVIRVGRDDVDVICTDGDQHLGGADWDNAIRDFLLRGFTEENPQFEAASNEEFMQELAYSAEPLKVALSSTMTRRHMMRFGGWSARLELTREHFEELTSELRDRTMEITARTLATAQSMGVEWLDDVLLVGGMTRMPVIARMLRERFGFEPRLLPDPHMAVVKGAALFALMKKVKISLSDDGDSGTAEQIADQLGISVRQVENLAAKRVVTVVPRAFGIKVIESADRAHISHLLTADTPLPADTGPLTFYTVFGDQRKVQMEVWEQAGSICSEELEHNRHVCDVVLTDLPPLPAHTPLEVFFHMTETGLLRMHGRDLATRRKLRIEIQAAGLDKTKTRQATAESSPSSQRVPPTSAANVAADQHLPQATKPRQPKIFLCHSSSDKPSVRALRRKLLEDDCQPWLDEEEILPGQDWDYEIRRAIRASDLVLVCLSRTSVNKVGYLQKEIRSVLDVADEQPEGTIFVIPARLEPCDVPERLRRYHWVDLFEDTGYPRLLRAVRNRRSE
jgi:molecular chaperone DnaK